MTSISPQQWQEYDREGYLKLGKLLSDSELASLQQRIDDIMLGKAKLEYDKMLMQLDGASGKYEDAGVQSTGFKGATLGYRKIQQLEHDPLFLTYMQRPIFRDICERVYGKGTPISCMRAMFMNKPAHKGTFLPFHQDRWTNLDHDPLVTVWTALDPCTPDNGCVKIIPRSHHKVINPSHAAGFLTPEQAAEHCPKDKWVDLVLEAGEVVLLHNWLLHGSDVNRTETPRRAFSVCYMDARTKNIHGDEKYNVIFGEGALRANELQAA